MSQDLNEFFPLFEKEFIKEQKDLGGYFLFNLVGKGAFAGVYSVIITNPKTFYKKMKFTPERDMVAKVQFYQKGDKIE